MSINPDASKHGVAAEENAGSLNTQRHVSEGRF